MSYSKWEMLEAQCAELTRDVSELKADVHVLREKQSAHTTGHDGIKAQFTELAHRLHSVENFMLSSLQRLAFIKTLFRFWPVLMVTLLFCFSIGIFVDDQKVAEEIRDKIELNLP